MVFFSFLATIIFLRNNDLAPDFFDLFAHIPHYDKLGHFILMGILAFLSTITIAPILPYKQIKSTLIVLGGVLLLIALEEYSQIFIATRTFSYADFACDFLGVVAFGWLGHFYVINLAPDKS